MSRWRPKGWENPYLQDISSSLPVTDYTPLIRPEPHEAFEAGADAMLEALRAMSKNLTDGCGNINSIYKYVHIPDDTN